MFNKIILAVMIMITLLFVTGANAALNVPVLDQDILTSKTGYRYICGPTVATEIMAYWAKNGYTSLMAGQPSGLIPDVSQPTFDLFLQMVSYSGYTGYYTYPQPLVNGIKKYFNEKNYDVDVILTKQGYVYWNDVVKEIDAGRPVILLDYARSHYMVLSGYATSPVKSLTVLYGHVPLVRTMKLSDFTPSRVQAIFVRPKALTPTPEPEPEPEPEITPYNETWYPEAKAWCDANGWVIQKKQ